MGKQTVFGLTGGIASGKTGIAKRWTERGLPVVEADFLSRSVVVPHSDGWKAVVQHFGREVLLQDETLDRRKMGSIVFHDRAKLTVLEGLLGPLMNKKLEELCETLHYKGHDLVCYESALLVDKGLAGTYRPLVVATADKDVRVLRIMKRDRLSADEAAARMKNQVDEEQRALAADWIISTDGRKETTLAMADLVLDEICRRRGVDPSRYFVGADISPDVIRRIT